MKNIRISILGAGNIAHRMADTVNAVEGVTLRAVASRDLKKAEAFAEKHGAEKAFGSYEELYNDPDTDVVYVATPHSFHFEQAKASLLHGKHAICEKPMTINARQAKELFDIAGERGLFVSEAIWTRYIPLAEVLREKLTEGVIGEPRIMTANYGFNSDAPRMIEPSLAGGALLDLGIYPLTVISMVFGEEIEKIQTSGVLTDKGVDAHSVTLITFKDGKMATMMTSIDTIMDSKVIIYGSEGRIEMNFVCNWESIDIYGADGRLKERIPREQQLNGFEYEVAAMAEAIREGKPETEKVPRALLVRMMERMDALRSAWGMRYPGED
ncbi:MAG: Gfo/Idh/MocA family oxidoreductase [Oscillospiraceae bacterium]|nr:Gfo/Idh/MocA family oxidoreductase [Oscillospiraceae bacterium]